MRNCQHMDKRRESFLQINCKGKEQIYCCQCIRVKNELQGKICVNCGSIVKFHYRIVNWHGERYYFCVGCTSAPDYDNIDDVMRDPPVRLTMMCGVCQLGLVRIPPTASSLGSPRLGLRRGSRMRTNLNIRAHPERSSWCRVGNCEYAGCRTRPSRPDRALCGYHYRSGRMKKFHRDNHTRLLMDALPNLPRDPASVISAFVIGD